MAKTKKVAKIDENNIYDVVLYAITHKTDNNSITALVEFAKRKVTIFKKVIKVDKFTEEERNSLLGDIKGKKGITDASFIKKGKFYDLRIEKKTNEV